MNNTAATPSLPTSPSLPAHRGRGIGRALLAAAEAHARKEGARELRIAVLAENGVAAGLYRDAGFRPYLVTMSKSLVDEEADPARLPARPPLDVSP